MDTSFDSVLQGCLAAMENGEVIEPLVDRYPRYRAALQSLLAASRQVQMLDQRPSPAAQQRNLNAFLTQARALSRRPSTPARVRTWLRPVVALTTVLAALVVISVSAVRASEAALPGDPLYGLKRFYEDVQRALTVDEASRTQLDQMLSQRRREEVRALQTVDRAVVVEFDGAIVAMRAQHWQIDQIEVAINSQTTLTGETPRPGARVRVVGRLRRDEALLATHIYVLSAAPPPVAAPTLTLVSLPAATPLPPTTAPEDPPPAPEPTVTPRPAPTHEPEPTRTPKPDDIEFGGVVEAMNGDVWLIAGRTVIIDAGADIRGAIEVGSRVKVKAKQLADGTLHARRIERREDKPKPTAPPGQTPPPAQTPPPKPTQPEKLKFKGVVISMDGDHWTIGDKHIRVDGGTDIQGDISIGTKVKGQAIRQSDGTWLATRIEQND